MPLYQAELYLELARLLQARKRGQQARFALEQARDLIQKTGYARGRAEVKHLAQQLGLK